MIISSKSIFEHIVNLIHPPLPGLLPCWESLPDDSEFEDDPDISWAPGSRDVLFDPQCEPEREEIQEKLNLIYAAFREKGESLYEKLENLFSYPRPLDLINQILSYLIKSKDIDQTEIYLACRKLLVKTGNRSVVKFCIGIISLYGMSDDLQVIKIFGRHEEFTLYSSFAVMSYGGDPATHWLEMASHVTGWGRIHLVSRLIDSKRQDVKEFLLKEGCHNDISPEYVALSIARSVDLSGILKSEKIDKKTFKSAGLILGALINASGNKNAFLGIDMYKKAPAGVISYLGHASEMARSLDDFITISVISDMVSSDEKIIRYGIEDWNKKDLLKIRKAAGEILSKEIWVDLVVESFRPEDVSLLRRAVYAAERMKLDLESLAFDYLRSHPDNDVIWQYLASKANRSVAGILADFALENPAVFNKTGCIYALSGMLFRFPGVGIEILRRFMESDIPDVKLLSLKIANIWPEDSLDGGIYKHIADFAEDQNEIIKNAAGCLARRFSLV